MSKNDLQLDGGWEGSPFRIFCFHSDRDPNAKWYNALRYYWTTYSLHTACKTLCYDLKLACLQQLCEHCCSGFRDQKDREVWSFGCCRHTYYQNENSIKPKHLPVQWADHSWKTTNAKEPEQLTPLTTSPGITSSPAVSQNGLCGVKFNPYMHLHNSEILLAYTFKLFNQTLYNVL